MMTPGRLAFRTEGNYWNCYYAKSDTMGDAVLLGSIRLTCADNPARRSAFMTLMWECFGDSVEAITGVRPYWLEPEGVPAPEHEKTKNA